MHVVTIKIKTPKLYSMTMYCLCR